MEKSKISCRIKGNKLDLKEEQSVDLDLVFSALMDRNFVKDIAYNSKNAGEDIVFVAIKGEKVDGHNFIENAYDKGSRIFLVEYIPETFSLNEAYLLDSTFILIEDTRLGLSRISSVFFRQPSKELKVIGITGTKGKTTTANYICNIIKEKGYSCGIIGTNGIQYKDVFQKTENTTPESYELHKVIRAMVDAGVDYLCMEVSSGGVKMKRVSDIDFEVGLFINITPDHIGPMEHPDFQDYLECKTQLLKMSKTSIINKDDEEIWNISQREAKTIRNLKTMSLNTDAYYKAVETKEVDGIGSSFTCLYQGGKFSVFIPSPGIFTIYNGLAAVSVAKELEIDDKSIINALRSSVVEGRMNTIEGLQGINLIVDYAHNKVSFLNLLSSIETIERKRLIAVFGSVGERTKLRRKDLGQLVGQYCQIAVITSENPGNEPPMDIIDEIASYIEGENCKIYKYPDRRDAVEKAIEIAEEGDLIIFTGRGHEDYNIIGDKKLPYPKDMELVREAVAKRQKGLL